MLASQCLEIVDGDAERLAAFLAEVESEELQSDEALNIPVDPCGDIDPTLSADQFPEYAMAADPSFWTVDQSAMQAAGESMESLAYEHQELGARSTPAHAYFGGGTMPFPQLDPASPCATMGNSDSYRQASNTMRRRAHKH